MSDQREEAQKWIEHHLEAASSIAEEIGDKEIQDLIDELALRLRQLYAH